jgi:oligosaccharide repeat unit polymerase
MTKLGATSIGQQGRAGATARRDVQSSIPIPAVTRATKARTPRLASGLVTRPPQGSSHPVTAVLLVCYIMFGVYLIVSKPTNLDDVIALNYDADIIAYFVMAGLFLLIQAKHDMDMFDPLVIVSVIYISIFALAPIHDIILDDYYQFDVNTLVFGVKGTVIAVGGYLAMCFGYSLHQSPRAHSERDQRHHVDGPKIARLALSIWVLAFASALVGAMAGGAGATYVLSLGLIGETGVRPEMGVSLGFTESLALALIPTAIIYAYFGRSRWWNLILQLLTFTVMASQGYRYIVLIFLLSHLYVLYMRRGVSPRPLVIATALGVLVLFSGAMEFYRGAMRTGGSVDWAAFGLGDLGTAIFGNLGIYKTYYGVVHAVPSQVPYGLGGQMFVYTAIMFVPRAIWPGKPLPPIGDTIRASVSDYAAMAGAAYPNIGEYYVEFGVLGVVVFMGIFGVALNYIRTRLRHSSDVLDLVLYAVLVTSTFQVVIRGYTPSNFPMVLLLALPVVVVKYLSEGRRNPLRRRPSGGSTDTESRRP